MLRWLLLACLVVAPAAPAQSESAGFVLVTPGSGVLTASPSGLRLRPAGQFAEAWCPLALDEGVWTLRFRASSQADGSLQATFLDTRVRMDTGAEPRDHALTGVWRGIGGVAFGCSTATTVSELTFLRLPFDVALGPAEPLESGLSVVRMVATGTLPEEARAVFRLDGRPVTVAPVAQGTLEFRSQVRPEGLLAVEGEGLLEWRIVDGGGATLHAGGRLRLPWAPMAWSQSVKTATGLENFAGATMEAWPAPVTEQIAVDPSPQGPVKLPLASVGTWLDRLALEVAPRTTLWAVNRMELERLRAFDWLALHHGARGIVYPVRDPDTLRPLLDERQTLAAYLAEPPARLPTVPGLDAALWRRPEASLLSIVNLTTGRLSGGLRLGGEVGKVWKLPEGAPFEPGEMLTVDVAPFDVALYVLEPR